MHHLHIVEEIVGIERHADVVANLLGDAEVGRIVGTDAIGVEHIAVVGAHHKVVEVVVEMNVVFLGPLVAFQKGNALIRIVPRAIVFWIECLVFVVEVVAQGTAVVIEAAFYAQRHDKSYLGNMRGNGGVEVQLP